MKRIVFFSIILLMFLGNVYAQSGLQSGLNEKEPAKRQLGAPLYPRTVFIRTTAGLDPYYETAEYITSDDVSTVLGYFETRLPKKREIIYEDKDTYLVIFLLKTWSPFPDRPPKEALSQLEREPNVQLREFHEGPYAPLIEYFDRKPGGKPKADALREGRTMILYTYRISEVDRSKSRLIGAWKESDRDLAYYWGSILEFRTNGTYKFTFTEQNLKAMAQILAGREPFKDMGSDAVQKILAGKNPETGAFAITKNVISLESPNPVDGVQKKNGLASIGNASLSLELVNKPKLVFVRVPESKPAPGKKK
ncbi:MAG: hypothetical protein Q8O92_09045 [Candidatus Latescibacter sp.]|nr:hypothetical protein [Candidatus Latescibacter sp.]